MGLKEQLMNDFKQVMKAHDNVARNTISMARAAIKQYEIDNREELDDQGIVQILQKQVKMRKDALADFEKAGRTDLKDAYNQEIEVLERYLPKMLSKDEIRAEVEKIASAQNIERSKKSMGRLMGCTMKELKGRADGNDVREVVSDFLSEE